MLKVFAVFVLLCVALVAFPAAVLLLNAFDPTVIVLTKTIGGSSAACGQCSASNRQVAANATLSGIEMVHMMRKRQARFAFNPNPLIAE